MTHLKFEIINKLPYKRYGVSITSSKFSHGGDDKLLYKNKGFTLEQFVKWKWYFEYRAALYKIQNPKLHIEVQQTQYFDLPEKHIREKDLKNKIKSAKGDITKIKNKIRKFKDKGGDLFPESNPSYQKALTKLNYKKDLLSNYESELKKL